MPLTQLRPDYQVGPSLLVNDQLAPGPALQSAATSLQDELNAVKSQLSRILSVQSQSWTSDIQPDAGGNKRGLNSLGGAVYNVENKPFLSRARVQTVINVPAGQNYVLLSAATNQTPSQTAALQPSTLGTVVAASTANAAAFSGHELTAAAGDSPSNPSNLCRIRSAGTGQQLENNDRDISALLQVESTAADGAAFNDTSGGARVKLSFVSEDASGALVAVPASAVGGQAVQYAYFVRRPFIQMPEQAFAGGGDYQDRTSDLDITLTRAVANQGQPVLVGKTLQWQVNNGFSMKFQDQGGARDLASFSSSPGANAVTFTPDSFTLNTTNAPVSRKGMIVGQAAQALNLGTTNGQIDSAGPLTVASTGSNALTLKGGTATNFQDGYQAGSTWAGAGINLASTSADWTAYKLAVGGEASLLAGIAALAAKTNRVKVYATVTQNIPAGTLITGYGTGANLSAPLPDYSAVVGSISKNFTLYLNGQLLRIGTSAADNFDGYISGTPAKGELVLNFPLRYSATSADTLCLVLHSIPVT